MSVEKLNDSSNVYSEQNPFAQILNTVIENIKDNDAFRIWSYSLSKSTNWKVIKDWTEKVCGVGQRKAKQVWSYLYRANLIDYIVVRDDRGKIVSHDLRILNGTKFDPSVPFLASKSIGAETAPVAHPVDNIHRCKNPPGGQTTRVEMYPLLNKDITKQRKETKQRESTARKKRSPLSDSFQPGAKAKALCRERGFNEALIVQKFISYSKANGKMYSDEQAAFELWILNEKNLITHQPSKVKTSSPHLDDSAYKPCTGCRRPTSYCECHLASRETNIAAMRSIKAFLGTLKA